MKQIIIIILGLALGAVSFFWLGYSILTLGNFMEEPGSLDYVAEGESIRIFGLLGAFYISWFLRLYYFSYINKNAIYIVFLVSMLLGGIIPGIYIFVLR